MRRLALIAAVLLAVPASAQTSALVFFLGDSTVQGLPFTAGRLAWPQRLQLNRQQQRFAAVNMGVGGLRCDQVETDVFNRDVLVSGKGRGQTRVVLQCGLNDLLQNRTADQIWGAEGTAGAPGTPGSSTTPGPMLRMVNALVAAGIPVTVLTATPLGGSYNYPSGVQTEHMSLNARIRAKAGGLVTVVDVYRALGQTGAIATALATNPGDGVTMPAPFNYGDGLHFTTGNGSVIDATTGDGRMAEALNAVAGALP